jgi:hypothetical protein
MELENLATTQLLARVTPLTNAKAYQVQTIAGTGAWQDVGTYTQARRVVLSNLTPGIIYHVRVRGIGGSTGYSDWSNPVSLMAT